LELIDKHKAGIITFLITGIVVFAMFSFHIKKQSDLIAESYYEVEPITPEELKQLEELEALEKALKTTDQASNENEEFKEMMKNFKSMQANDFENTTKNPEEEAFKEENDVVTGESSHNSSSGYSVNQEELEKYRKAKDVLAMRTPEKKADDKKSNSVSTLTYSLKDRTLLDYDTPRYLCEYSGKIVINITVNGQGRVMDAYLNNSSTSTNECLIDAALNYAKIVQFDPSATPSQLGSITFQFKGKY
jgi:TonB family protein